jgi:hypothetical protein
MQCVFVVNWGTQVVVPLLLLGLGGLVAWWTKLGLLTPDYVKLVFGFVLLILVAAIGGITLSPTLQLTPAESQVTTQILTIVGVLGGAFAQWAFNQKDKGEK